jgi:hypothetical protein
MARDLLGERAHVHIRMRGHEREGLRRGRRARRVGDAPCQLARHGEVRLGVAVQHLEQASGGEPRDRAVPRRAHAGRARIAGQQRDLSDQLPGSEIAQQSRLAGRLAKHLHPPLEER